MTRAGQSCFFLFVPLAGGLLCCGTVTAQTSTNTSTSKPAAINSTLHDPTPPPMPIVKSPVELFRELLAMDSEERYQALAKRTPEGRKRIMAKLREYQSLRPEERELRLRATELSWYLQPLMHVVPTNRTPLIEQIPPDLRRLVQLRLLEWDLLPPPLQAEILTNEVAIRYFGGSEANLNTLTNLSAARRTRLEAGIAQWRALPEPKRQEILDRFNNFFEHRPEDKNKTLHTLSEAERAQMEKTLRSYSNLNSDQREQCLRSFEKFTEMSLPERQRFLKNAERWKIMSPSERQAWRELVRQMPYTPLDGGVPRTPRTPNNETASATNGR